MAYRRRRYARSYKPRRKRRRYTRRSYRARRVLFKKRKIRPKARKPLVAHPIVSPNKTVLSLIKDKPQNPTPEVEAMQGKKKKSRGATL